MGRSEGGEVREWTSEVQSLVANLSPYIQQAQTSALARPQRLLRYAQPGFLFASLARREPQPPEGRHACGCLRRQCR